MMQMTSASPIVPKFPRQYKKQTEGTLCFERDSRASSRDPIPLPQVNHRFKILATSHRILYQIYNLTCFRQTYSSTLLDATLDLLTGLGDAQFVMAPLWGLEIADGNTFGSATPAVVSETLVIEMEVFWWFLDSLSCYQYRRPTCPELPSWSSFVPHTYFV